MSTTKRLQRTLIVGLFAGGLALAAVGPAAADIPRVPKDAVIVSSIDATGAFTMTASNIGDAHIDLVLAAPGNAEFVAVDMGAYDDVWTIASIAPGEMATMTGRLTG